MGKKTIYHVRRDKILAVDFEETCNEGPMPTGETPEVIEIGIAEIDVKSLAITRTDGFFVRNTLSSVSPYCTSLTGITQEMLDKEGRHLGEVVRSIRKKYGTNTAWLGWGRDRYAIERDCAAKAVENPFSAVYYDLGLSCSMTVGTGKSIGLINGLNLLGIEPQAVHHRAKEDAIAAANFWIECTRIIRHSMGLSAEVSLSNEQTGLSSLKI